MDAETGEQKQPSDENQQQQEEEPPRVHSPESNVESDLRKEQFNLLLQYTINLKKSLKDFINQLYIVLYERVPSEISINLDFSDLLPSVFEYTSSSEVSEQESDDGSNSSGF